MWPVAQSATCCRVTGLHISTFGWCESVACSLDCCVLQINCFYKCLIRTTVWWHKTVSTDCISQHWHTAIDFSFSFDTVFFSFVVYELSFSHLVKTFVKPRARYIAVLPYKQEQHFCHVEMYELFVKAQGDRNRPLTANTRFRSQATPLKVFGSEGGTWICFSLSNFFKKTPAPYGNPYFITFP